MYFKLSVVGRQDVTRLLVSSSEEKLIQNKLSFSSFEKWRLSVTSSTIRFWFTEMCISPSELTRCSSPLDVKVILGSNSLQICVCKNTQLYISIYIMGAFLCHERACQANYFGSYVALVPDQSKSLILLVCFSH